jgi:hypothetical protein
MTPKKSKKLSSPCSVLSSSRTAGSGSVFDFGVMESLAAQGLISDPRGRAESVYLTPEGLARAKAAADKMFGQ